MAQSIIERGSTRQPASAVTLSSLDTFDLARWKPLSGDKFLEEMVAVGLSADERVMIPSENSTLDDGRDRVVFYAEVLERPSGNRTVAPYLAVFFDSEANNRPTAFIRTDVVLAHEAS